MGVRTTHGVRVLFFATINEHGKGRPLAFLAMAYLQEASAVEDDVTIAAGMQPAMFKVVGHGDGQTSAYALPIDLLTWKACLCSVEGSSYLLKSYSTSHMR